MRVGELWSLTSGLDEEGFTGRFPEPALVIPPFGRGLLEPLFETHCGERGASLGGSPPVGSLRIGMIRSRRPMEEHPSSWSVHFITKTSRNPFGSMVTVGRASTNDICLEDPTVSKVHAALVFDGARWTIVDPGSKNGTYLNGHRAQPKRAMRIDDGSHISFGNTVAARFYLPPSLLGFLRLQGSRLTRTVET